jgi:hypothetical protein
LVTNFIDKVLRDIASRASIREPTLTYRKARKRWLDMLEKRAGYGTNRPRYRPQELRIWPCGGSPEA